MMISFLKRLFGQKPDKKAGPAIEVVGSIRTHEIVEGGRAIKCLKCGMTSWHPKDVEHLYCGNCHRFHERPRWRP